MNFQTHLLCPALGAEIRGLGIAPIADSITLSALRTAWLKYGVLLFRGLSDVGADEFISFARQFGEPELHDQVQFTLEGYPTIALVSNIQREGRYIGATKAGRNWHSDSQYLRVPPSGSILYASKVPPMGGDTLFANTAIAYDELPHSLKQRIRTVRVTYSRVRAYAQAHPDRPPLTDAEIANLPDVEHPLVRTHPETGRQSLYIGGVQHGGRIIGMPIKESDLLLEDLRAHATQERFVYRHEWRDGDLIIWDNRSTLHCATPFDESLYDRLMLRIQLAGTVPA
jgi:taurine dioxygenase